MIISEASECLRLVFDRRLCGDFELEFFACMAFIFLVPVGRGDKLLWVFERLVWTEGS